jgi:hypothetical protein
VKLRKLLASIFFAALAAGCATSDPVMSGKPQDWVGHEGSELRSVMGEPTRVIPNANGDQVWEYEKSKDFIIPRGENMSLGFAGIGSSAGGAGGFSMEKRPDDQQSRETQLFRFKIRNGKVVRWYANRAVNGKIVWEDQ